MSLTALSTLRALPSLAFITVLWVSLLFSLRMRTNSVKKSSQCHTASKWKGRLKPVVWPQRPGSPPATLLWEPILSPGHPWGGPCRDAAYCPQHAVLTMLHTNYLIVTQMCPCVILPQQQDIQLLALKKKCDKTCFIQRMTWVNDYSLDRTYSVCRPQAALSTVSP